MTVLIAVASFALGAALVAAVPGRWAYLAILMPPASFGIWWSLVGRQELANYTGGDVPGSSVGVFFLAICAEAGVLVALLVKYLAFRKRSSKRARA